MSLDIQEVTKMPEGRPQRTRESYQEDEPLERQTIVSTARPNTQEVFITSGGKGYICLVDLNGNQEWSLLGASIEEWQR